MFCVISHKKKHSAQCDLTTGKILNQVTNILIIIDLISLNISTDRIVEWIILVLKKHLSNSTQKKNVCPVNMQLPRRWHFSPLRGKLSSALNQSERSGESSSVR